MYKSIVPIIIADTRLQSHPWYFSQIFSTSDFIAGIKDLQLLLLEWEKLWLYYDFGKDI